MSIETLVVARPSNTPAWTGSWQQGRFAHRGICWSRRSSPRCIRIYARSCRCFWKVAGSCRKLDCIQSGVLSLIQVHFHFDWPMMSTISLMYLNGQIIKSMTFPEKWLNQRPVMTDDSGKWHHWWHCDDDNMLHCFCPCWPSFGGGWAWLEAKVHKGKKQGQLCGVGSHSIAEASERCFQSCTKGLRQPNLSILEGDDTGQRLVSDIFVICCCALNFVVDWLTSDQSQSMWFTAPLEGGQCWKKNVLFHNDKLQIKLFHESVTVSDNVSKAKSHMLYWMQRALILSQTVNVSELKCRCLEPLTCPTARISYVGHHRALDKDCLSCFTRSDSVSVIDIDFDNFWLIDWALKHVSWLAFSLSSLSPGMLPTGNNIIFELFLAVLQSHLMTFCGSSASPGTPPTCRDGQ